MEGWLVYGISFALILLGEPLVSVSWVLLATTGSIPVGEGNLAIAAIAIVIASVASKIRGRVPK